MLVLNTEKKPIKMWLDDLEAGAVNQAINLANLPFIFRHIAIMPDAHQGYGMPIGGVMATHNVVVPNAVGVDIGCGMCAVNTGLKGITKEQLLCVLGGSKERQGGIRANIPVGMSKHTKAKEWAGFDKAPYDIFIQDHIPNAMKQLGTLGGGNHFIEIQKGSDGYIWVMIHSGSRHIGYQIAKHYNALAQKMCTKWHSNIPAFKGENGLAFLPLDSEMGHGYLDAMNWALDYAYANRLTMIGEIKRAFYKHTDASFRKEINIHHNYAAMENHFGENVMVHRKGATSARKGETGIIPGSQGTKSYIVCGKGNPESFNSCSHGAGRTMSRTKAQRNLDLTEQIAVLDNQNVIHSIRTIKDLDEAPGAYKDISIVMENQKDLVEVVVELTPLAVVKG